MNKWIAGISALIFSGAVYANCVTNSYMMDGRTVVCTTCCLPNGGGCNTV